jgi:hypothetical protein
MSPLGPAMDAVLSSGHLVKRYAELPLHGLKVWSDKVPFKMDALGLVTLLGADQVSTAIGSLQRRRYTGALPLLAAFVLVGHRFTSIEPGFTLYNVTESITSTNMSGWFTRWLMCQRINSATTVFEWKRRQRSSDSWWTRLIAMTVSSLLVMPLIIGTVMMGDWYGVANAGAIVVSIAARLYILGEQRRLRDRRMSPWDRRESTQSTKRTCVLAILSDGRMVTLQTTRSVLSPMVHQEGPMSGLFYRFAQQSAWVALGTHLLVLGMCTLVTQIYTVVLLVSSTVAVSSTTDWSADTQHKTASSPELGRPRDETVTIIPFNDDWNVIKTDPAREDRNENLDYRMVAWAKLGLSEQEEATMTSWNLFPETNRNPWWWEKYRALRDEFAAARHRNSDTFSPPSSSDIALQHMQPSVQYPQPSSPPVT